MLPAVAPQVSKLLAEGVAKDVGKAAVQRQLERALQGRISDRYLRKLTKSACGGRTLPLAARRMPPCLTVRCDTRATPQA